MVRSIAAKKLGPRRTAGPPSLLSGVRVLVVEDDYYLAMETKMVLEDAGAEVIGPYPNLEQVQRSLVDQRPDCAVVDINLGEGPSFKIAEQLEMEAVVFIFLTGYSSKAVPAKFGHIKHTQKPVAPSVLIEAVRLLSSR